MEKSIKLFCDSLVLAQIASIAWAARIGSLTSTILETRVSAGLISIVAQPQRAAASTGPAM